MKSDEKCGMMLTVRDGYLICPRCRVNKKMQPVDLDTAATNLTAFCRNCKLRIKIDIANGQCFYSRSR